MEVHLSTATIRAYRNNRGSMNLHFHPIVLFENVPPFSVSSLENLVWEISAEPIGLLNFSVEVDADSPLPLESGRNYIKFHLSRSDVSFQHDNYPCEIRFSAILDQPHASSIEIDRRFWGLVKAIW